MNRYWWSFLKYMERDYYSCESKKVKLRNPLELKTITDVDLWKRNLFTESTTFSFLGREFKNI